VIAGGGNALSVPGLVPIPLALSAHFLSNILLKRSATSSENYGIREIFDDAGTLPVGKWLDDLCHQLIATGLNKKVVIGCNMRFAALNQAQYHLMKQAGFSFYSLRTRIRQSKNPR